MKLMLHIVGWQTQQAYVQHPSTSERASFPLTSRSTSSEKTKKIRVFAGNLFGLGFLQHVSCIKPIPNHEKIFAVGKSGPNATFNANFSWVGLALGRGVRRCHT